MRISGNYGSHLPVLMSVLSHSTGDVLELGLGMFSTPYLHYQCLLANRHLVSYDNDKGWVKRFASSNFSNYHYEHPDHEFHYIANWDDAPIDRPWSVAFVDHSPDYRRIVDIARLANHAAYVVIHDSNAEFEPVYHYSRIYPFFRYRKTWTRDARHTDVLSNFVPLDTLWTP